jgi:hypothetical protein
VNHDVQSQVTGNLSTMYKAQETSEALLWQALERINGGDKLVEHAMQRGMGAAHTSIQSTSHLRTPRRRSNVRQLIRLWHYITS